MRSRFVLIFLLANSAGLNAEAADRQYWLGVHDFSVHDVDSHTYGVTGGIAFERKTRAGRHLVGTLDLFVDRDKDELDPDHIPIRWDVHLGSDGELWQGTHTVLGWTADINTRMNTVSSIEREITALPAIFAQYNGKIFQPSLKVGAGWFFLEIDDDVPKTRGYDRDDFRNSTFAYSAAADVTIRLGACCKLDGKAQQWLDSDEWLQRQYETAIHIGAGDWMKGSELMLSADFFEYNLDVYQRPGALPILPWDDDLLVRLMFKLTR